MTHMGGGVGHAVSDLVLQDKKNVNRIVLLQKPEKLKYIDRCVKNGIEVIVESSIGRITNLIKGGEEKEVVILHWWHHPVMCRFLYNFPEVPVRLVLWSHISGCTYPVLTYQFANKFSGIFFTSEYSLENPNWSEFEKKKICNKSNIIWGLGELSTMLPKCNYRLQDDKIKIGYTGTLARSKVHPEFAVICKRILDCISNAEFYLLGDKENGAWMIDQLQELGIADKVHLIGYVNNVNEWLIDFDIFGYPLNPYHFATTENSILEAMTVGLPIILFNQATEKYIVTHKEDGILADGIDDYVLWAVELAKNDQLRKKLGLNAIKNVYRKFSFKKNLKNFQKEIDNIALTKPLKISFKDILGDKPYNWFMSAVNENDKRNFLKYKYHQLPYIFLEKSKSSIGHFAENYPEDEKLRECVDLIGDI